MKPKKLAVISPNAGLTLAFKKSIEKLVDEMHHSLDYWILAAYKANIKAKKASQASVGANDASLATLMSDVVTRLTRRWNKRFNEAAKPLADYYTKAAKDRNDASLKEALRKSGYSVDFTLTPEIQNVLTAAVTQNVSLIKSIAQEHLSDVKELVMRSVQAGRDIGGLQKALQQRYNITRRRAALIARTSNNQTSSMLERARAQELGINEAIWVHAGGSKHPRREHVDFNGKTFDMEKGMWSNVDGQYVWPGTPINCHCLKRMVLKKLPSIDYTIKSRAK